LDFNFAILILIVNKNQTIRCESLYQTLNLNKVNLGKNAKNLAQKYCKFFKNFNTETKNALSAKDPMI